jgi:hypothetical protein
MTVDLCDFQVPPAAPGWYGVLTETGGVAALWTVRIGLNIRLWLTSVRWLRFPTAQAALDWARSPRTTP